MSIKQAIEPVLMKDGKPLDLMQSIDEAIKATENTGSGRLNAVLVAARAALAALRSMPEPVDDYEVRADGDRVRKDRWEYGIRRIVAVLWGNRKAFEIDEVVEAVRSLAPKDHEDDANLADAILATPSAPAAVEPDERTPQDYAIEHAEYMAQSAAHLIACVNDLALSEQQCEDDEANPSDVDAARESLTDAQGQLKSSIYEFRKRRDRASKGTK